MDEAEGNIAESTLARLPPPPRGPRQLGRPHPFSLGSMANNRYKPREPKDSGVADYGVVSEKSGNADGEKGVT